MTLITNILILLLSLMACYTQPSNALPTQSSTANIQSFPQSLNTNINNNAADHHHQQTNPTVKSIQHPPVERSEKLHSSRANIAPGLDRLLPVLDAFGNVGHSGHKEGGKPPVAEV